MNLVEYFHYFILYLPDRRISELENIMQRVEDSSKLQVDAAHAQLQEKTSEASLSRIENERLKVGT